MFIMLIHILRTLLTRCSAAGLGAVRRGSSNLYNQTQRIPVAMQRPGSRRSETATLRRFLGRATITSSILLSLAASAIAFDINSIARVDFVYGGASSALSSNIVTVAVLPPPSVATAKFLRLTPDLLGTVPTTTEFSTTDPATIYLPILPQPAAGTLAGAIAYPEGEMILFRIMDADQNLDPTAIDSILIRLDLPLTGDSEILRLSEESNNSGTFIGYIPAGTTGPILNDGFLTAPNKSLIDLSYDDGGTQLLLSAPVTAASASLWQTLSTPRPVVGQGDFVPYQATVENADPFQLASDVIMTQTLPAGFRYQPGSSRRDGVAMTDPLIGPDGRTLSFTIGDLVAGAVVAVDFVAGVSAAPPGRYTSTAQAVETTGILSNLAEVTIMIRDELFTNRSFLAGRVVQLKTCGDPASEVGVPGVRLFLEDGTFIITDQEGRYHVEGLKPGTHVVQLDPVTLPAHLKPVLCDDQTRFANNPSSRFIDLQGGTLWQADFYLSENVTDGEVTIRLDNRFGAGDEAIYSVQLSASRVATSNRSLNVTIPTGVTYQPGSATNNSKTVADPKIDGNRLTFSLDDPSGDWSETIEFSALIDSSQITREMRAQATLTFDTFNDSGISTPESESAMIWIAYDDRQEIEEYLLRPHFDTLDAELSQADIDKIKDIAVQLKQLDILHIIVSGHTDARKIRWEKGIPYKDNYELSRARAAAIADRLATGLNIAPEKIIVIGHAATVPISDNETEEGRFLNRRAELKIYHLKRYPLVSEAIDLQSGDLRTVATEFRPVDPPPSPEKAEVGILSPYDGQKLAHSIESVRVRLKPGLTPKLLVDGIEIPPEKIGFTLDEKEQGTKLLSYIGIDFGEPGLHTLQFKGIDPFGNARFEQNFSMIRTGPIARIEIGDVAENRADGRTPVRIQLNLYDASDEQIEAVTKLELRRGDLIPYQSEKDRLPRTPETGMVTVDAHGIALFDPVSQSGRYPVVLGFGGSEIEIEIHVKPEQREWILVGLGDGTLGYNSLSGNIQTLPDSADEDFYTDGRVAFFARGQIKGEWLLTLAYDSDKEGRKDRTLHQVIDPNNYYTLYGDATNQGYAAASAEKLYVRVERDRFYAVFGDYETGLTTAELSRYSRSMTGIKSEYAGNNFGYNAFASETGQSFVRDEIRGDGTSGLYRLTRNDLVLNSEKISIEVRDRYHSEQIISNRSLQQHIDYNINYDNGTLFFKEPVVSQDENFNPIYIVVEYETFSNSDNDYQYGGRAYLRGLNQTFELGASYIHEGVAGTEGDLYGADATWKITPSTTLRGEYATTDQTSTTGTISGDAWLTELQHSAPIYDARAYYREQHADFGLGQQNASETGTRKYGADGDWRFSKLLSLSAEAFRQENLSTDAERTVAAANINYAESAYLLTGGLRRADDQLATGEHNRSNQAILGADWYATEKLTLRARQEQSIGGGTQSSDYLSRSLLGLDYILNKMVTTFAQQEYSFGDNADTSATRLGLRATPWNGFQARSSVEQQLDEQTRRIFANLGMTQSWQINPYWSSDISIDRSETLRGEIKNPIHPDQPSASGSSDDFTAVSVGSNLRKQFWSWDNRIEFRTSNTEDRWGLNTGYMVEPKSGLGLSLSLFLIQENRKLTGDRTTGDLRLGLAWRPEGGGQIILNRLDLIRDRDYGTTSEIDSWRIINRLKGHWRLTQDLNLALQYGSKYFKETINALELSGYIDSPGGELRYDLNRKWDIGLHAAALHQWDDGQISYRTGTSLGYSPVTNLWISLGYNFTGFSDKDLSGSDHTAQGAFLKFRFKFDQNSVKDALTWLERA
jgi:uncharacterized repeat protein (TIGR01451 family)